MSKNLKVVQTTSRVLEIICKVLVILCLVGAIASTVGVVLLSLSYLFPKLVDRIEGDNGRKVFQLIGDCLVGLIVSIQGIIVSKAHKDYFAMEQKDGTPFTAEGAKAFRTLGIMNIVAPIIASIVAAIIGAIFKCWDDFRFDFGLGLGIAMILLSFVFAYGAEIEQGKGECCCQNEGEKQCCCHEEAKEEAAPAEPAQIEEK